MEMNIQHKIALDWSNILKESAKMTSNEKAMLEELIMRPYIRRAIHNLRSRYKLPTHSSFGTSKLENDAGFLEACEAEVRKKFGFPEEFTKTVMDVVLYGKIEIPTPTRQKASLGARINKAIETAEFFGQQGCFLYVMPDAPLNPDIFQFQHGGTTIGIDLESVSVTINQTPTGNAEEIKALIPLVDGYRKALRTHCAHYRNKEGKQGKRGDYSFIINCFIYQAIVEEEKDSNENILAVVQARLEGLLPSNVDVHAMKEFKLNKKGVMSGFNKRVQRIRDVIENENLEDD